MIKKKPRDSWPDVVLAVLSRDPSRLRTLIKSGSDVNEKDSDGRTGLHHAAISGDLDVTNLLLDAGAAVHAVDHDGWTPLHMASQEYHVPIAELLLASGAPVDAEDQNGNTPLSRAVFASRGRGEMITLLLRYGADKAHKNKHGVSPSDLASMIANYDVKRWLS